MELVLVVMLELSKTRKPSVDIKCYQHAWKQSWTAWMCVKITEKILSFAHFCRIYYFSGVHQQLEQNMSHWNSAITSCNNFYQGFDLMPELESRGIGDPFPSNGKCQIQYRIRTKSDERALPRIIWLIHWYREGPYHLFLNTEVCF